MQGDLRKDPSAPEVPMEPPPAYAPNYYPDAAAGAAYNNPAVPVAAAAPQYGGGQYGGGQYGGQYADPTAQPMVAQGAQPVAMVAQGAQPVVAQPVYMTQNQPQVVIVQQETNACCSIACFVLGWFFFFPWFACYCADGGVCSPSPTAKSFNIASLVMLILSLSLVLVWVVLLVAVFSAACTSCSTCPDKCTSCSQCVKHHTFCTSLFDERAAEAWVGSGSDRWGDGYCTGGLPELEVTGDYSCFDDKTLCIGGFLGGIMEMMSGSRCMEHGEPNMLNEGDTTQSADMTAQAICYAHENGPSGEGGSGGGGGGGGAAPAGMQRAASGVLTPSCRSDVLDVSGANEFCDAGYHCDTCGWGELFTGWGNCIACEEGYELDVWSSDCTGECVLKADFSASSHRSLKKALADGFCGVPAGATCAQDQMEAVSSPAA